MCDFIKAGEKKGADKTQVGCDMTQEPWDFGLTLSALSDVMIQIEIEFGIMVKENSSIKVNETGGSWNWLVTRGTGVDESKRCYLSKNYKDITLIFGYFWKAKKKKKTQAKSANKSKSGSLPSVFPFEQQNQHANQKDALRCTYLPDWWWWSWGGGKRRVNRTQSCSTRFKSGEIHSRQRCSEEMLVLILQTDASLCPHGGLGLLVCLSPSSANSFSYLHPSPPLRTRPPPLSPPTPLSLALPLTLSLSPLPFKHCRIRMCAVEEWRREIHARSVQ